MKEITINAAGKKLGRLASEVAVVLRGKNEPSYEKRFTPEVKVVVTNAGAITITDRKLASIEHKHYSGYPGGLKVLSGKQVAASKGKREILRKAIYGMLPKNNQRDGMMKNLTVTE